MTLNLKKGDPWPFQSRRGLTGEPIAPVWYALNIAPQAEKRVTGWLNGAGVRVTYPTRTKTRHVAGKKREYELPIVGGLIYAEFRYQPHWDVMRERRVINSVMSIGDVPVALSPDVVSQVMGLPSEAERIEQERLEALRPKVGQKAEITEGPLAGFFVDVTRVEFGRVWYEMVSGLKGSAEVGIVRAAE